MMDDGPLRACDVQFDMPLALRNPNNGGDE
jgi:hypothetical protein